MKNNRTTLVIPILLITVGSGWLLSTLGIMPGIDWVWTLSLAIVGLLSLVVGGLNKVTVVVGPFFILTSLLSVLRQTGRLDIDVEIPLLVIVGGILLLLARSSAIPTPKWILEVPAKD